MPCFRCLLIVVLMPWLSLVGASPTGVLAMSRPMLEAHAEQSGLHVLEKGEDALLARAWLSDHAEQTIDIQYFIWSKDNIGILASEFLLRAAERGVKVRVIVDDLLMDAPSDAMLALAMHPNFDIRIYNPRHKVGVSLPRRLFNLVTDFKAFNQRMHDKTAIFDGQVAITGGRNMADEYYGYDRAYNFRDRDALVMGPVVGEMQASFERFWHSPFCVPVEELVGSAFFTPSPEYIQSMYRTLHAYAENPANYADEVKAALHDLPQRFGKLAEEMAWGDVRFLADDPGKNRRFGLGGGGRTTAALVEVLASAQHTVVIQSPYVVLSRRGMALFRKLVDRGVKVRISTNSLASTDNVQAFSGYRKQRKALLAMGVELAEFKPDPAIKKDLMEQRKGRGKTVPTFSLHAKTLVVDGKRLFIGTFNLDPRSANLNTEVGVLIEHETLAGRVEAAIERDMETENSWNPATENPDQHASADKRRKVFLWRKIPMDAIL